ncbi:type I 3-dehydroquinate dehydratase [Haladaptatus salinisoli]|uniref:type I 3-dehydroquinate dehydratase n=1 Tax=Haladaptatus salinisoli TaxID=2884876 RepID=UPI001D0B2557|nr:type I 3-dehydroquinate dehydratase [Haladaptatus salinisoli]
MEFDTFALAASTADLGAEPRARDHADLVEFRMDLADDPLDSLSAYDGDLPVLATNRAAWEGGEATGDERLDALAAAAERDAVVAIDVELESLFRERGAAVAERARANDAAVVASVHDFDTTPPREKLRELLEDATDRADVGKLAVTARTRSDVLDLLAVTDDLTERGRRVATVAMGEVGKHSRAVAPLYGSKIGYAPLDSADATAPGQYDLTTLSRLVRDLGG